MGVGVAVGVWGWLCVCGWVWVCGCKCACVGGWVLIVHYTHACNTVITSSSHAGYSSITKLMQYESP